MRPVKALIRALTAADLPAPARLCSDGQPWKIVVKQRTRALLLPTRNVEFALPSAFGGIERRR